jgi:hypothetical protein
MQISELFCMISLKVTLSGDDISNETNILDGTAPERNWNLA